MKIKTLAFSTLAVALLAGCQTAPQMEMSKSDKIIIAHRGASGYLPEHTLESKALAFAQHAGLFRARFSNDQRQPLDRDPRPLP